MTDIKIEGDLGDVGQAATARSLYENGYKIAHTGHSIVGDKASDFIAAMQLEGYKVCDLREFDDTITAFSPDRTLFVRASICHYVDIYTNQDDSTHIAAFFNQFREYFELNRSDPKNVRVQYYYHNANRGTNDTTIHIEKSKITKTYPELYPDYDVAELVRQYIASPESILLLYGPPGVGKTQFVRYVMSEGAFDSIAYVKDRKVLEAGDFWAEMAQRDFDLMIFDDMDDGLQPRKTKKGTDFTSNLLSFSNGIFDKNTKIIITTNQEIEEIDAALVRPGRCFDFLTLHPLSFAQARDFWISTLQQSPAEFDRLYRGYDVITQASLMSDYSRERHSFTERSYVKSGNKNYNVQTKLQTSGVKVK